MKGLILAAGFGTRLRPHTHHVPKPLFTINGTTLLELAIDSLEKAGCFDIFINTHHLSEQITAFLETKSFTAKINVVYEPEILDTGGAVKNIEPFLEDGPLLVINSDVVSDVSLIDLYKAHLDNGASATLGLTWSPHFNHVLTDANYTIKGFHADTDNYTYKLTFTGFQVISKDILGFIPPDKPFSIIDAYRQAIQAGHTVQGFKFKDPLRWTDTGTPDSYRQINEDILCNKIFQAPARSLTKIRLKGDGSDRHWYRIVSDNKNTAILGDHGIYSGPPPGEADSFVNIGMHLYRSGVAVPEIYGYDTMSGLVFMEDLGDFSFHDKVIGQTDKIPVYQKALDLLFSLWLSGQSGFDPAWCYQTSAYNAEVIVKKECLYFINAFVSPIARITGFSLDQLMKEFHILADKIQAHALTGFMHRDFQSRNIMMVNDKPYAIDFQGGRTGPVQYDLASLLIDPYINLPEKTQTRLYEEFSARICAHTDVSEHQFHTGYLYCRLARNLQILGAFGYLSRVRQKTGFKDYIPVAIRSLKKHIISVDQTAFAALTQLIAAL